MGSPPPAGRGTAWLYALVFCVGAGSLGAEIAAVRLLAPYFGASTIVWANTIGIVLVALSVGYWLGGRLADRDPTERGLSRIALVGAAALAAVPFAARPLLGPAVDALDDISAGAFVGSLLGVGVLVAAPMVLLGAVSPWAIRLALSDVREAGTVAGRLYALSTAGSLVGTLSSALVLIPFVGTRRTFLSLALLIAIVAVLGLRPMRRFVAVPVAIAVLMALPIGTIKGSGSRRVVFETETPYQYARVTEDDEGVRRLELNEGQAMHSMYRPGTVLTREYWDGFLVLPFAVLDRPPRRIAILGNGAGTTARAYGHFFPSTRVDAVEIDAELSDIGRRYFAMRGPRLRVFAEDARPFLRRAKARYDAILIDVYRQPYIPFYLTTREFFDLVRRRLTPDGVTVVNVGHPEGQRELEQVVAATMASALPHVLRDPIEDTNTLIVGSSRRPTVPFAGARALPAALTGLASQASTRLGAPLRGGDVYTDDRAPVEWLVDRSILQYAADR